MAPARCARDCGVEWAWAVGGGVALVEGALSSKTEEVEGDVPVPRRRRRLAQ